MCKVDGMLELRRNEIISKQVWICLEIPGCSGNYTANTVNTTTIQKFWSDCVLHHYQINLSSLLNRFPLVSQSFDSFVDA